MFVQSVGLCVEPLVFETVAVVQEEGVQDLDGFVKPLVKHGHLFLRTHGANMRRMIP